MKQAEKGISTLKEKVDALVIIPNDRLKNASTKKITLVNAFEIADSVLKDAVQSISDLISSTGFINLDFADVRTVMKNRGLAHMGIGESKGEGRNVDAVRQAVASPLLETTIEGAKAVIINVCCGFDMSLDEVNEAVKLVKEVVDPSANTIFGATIDEEYKDRIKITVIATGFEDAEVKSVQEQTLRPITDSIFDKEKFANFLNTKELSSSDILNEKEPQKEGVKMFGDEEEKEDKPQQPATPSKPVEDMGISSNRIMVDDDDIPAFMRRKFH